jgi:hypothetical protein
VSIDHVGNQSVYSDFFAVCGFSFIGLLVSVRALIEQIPLSEMIFLL